MEPDLTKHGEELDFDECDFACTGTSNGEQCGGQDVFTAYVIVGSEEAPTPQPTPAPAPVEQPEDDQEEEEEGDEEAPAAGGEFVGCYEDSKASRALDVEGKNIFGNMTNEVSLLLTLVL